MSKGKGGGSTSVTVGYKYYYAYQLGLCYGEIDYFWRITLDDKAICFPKQATGDFKVNTPNLFGGEDLEGGFVGTISLYNGSYSQGRDSYLIGKLSSNVPAYRGIAHAVFRRPYIGTSPYLRDTAFLATRIDKTSDGSDQWYKEKSKIFRGLDDEYKNYFADELSTFALWIALDNSGSMSGLKLNHLKSSVSDLLDYLKEIFVDQNLNLDIGINVFGDSSGVVIKRSCNSSDINILKSVVDSMDASEPGTNFAEAFDGYSNFVSGTSEPKIISSIFVSDGEADYPGEPEPSGSVDLAVSIIESVGVDVFVYALLPSLGGIPDLQRISNTGDINIFNDDLSGLFQAFLNSILSKINLQIYDMNAIHIIRECLTDVNWGLGYTSSDIDSVSFESSANTCYNEKFGLSFLWKNETEVFDFIDLVLKHIDATLYQDNQTGKWKIKLIRSDYNVDTILNLTQDSIVEIVSLKKKEKAELVNQITIVFEDTDKSDKNSVTVQNIASMEQYGSVKSSSIEFLGISNASLASRVAFRELRANSFESYTATIKTTRIAHGLNRGDVFKLNYEFRTATQTIVLQDMVMRVVSIDYGNPTDNVITIDCIQDIFSGAPEIYIPQSVTKWVDDSTPPKDLQNKIAFESPYYVIAKILGDTNAQALDPDIGYSVVAGVANETAYFNYDLFTDIGTYEYYNSGDFCAYGETLEQISITSKTVTIINFVEIEKVNVGSFAILGELNGTEEIIRVESITLDSDGNYFLVFERGCIDTTRKSHVSGTSVFFCGEYLTTDFIEFNSGETSDVKLLPITARGRLALSRANELTVSFNSRKDRPYPPAKMLINTQSYPSAFTGDLNLSFVERNRLQQTVYVVHDEENTIASEAGTTYNLQIYRNDSGVDSTLLVNMTGITSTSLTVTSATIGYTGFISINLWAVRDGYSSYQKVRHILEKV